MAKVFYVKNVGIFDDTLNNYWKKFDNKNLTAEDFQSISRELQADEDTRSSLHSKVGNLFKDDVIYQDYIHGKEVFTLSAESVQRLVNTVEVTKEVKKYNVNFMDTYSYANMYHLPKVTEENKDAILMHFISNVTVGEAAKGFMDKSVSLGRFSKDQKHDAEVIVPEVPEVIKAKSKIEDSEKAKAPTISRTAKFFGWFQKKFGMNRAYREEYENYLVEKAKYDDLKNVTAEKELLSRYEALVEEKSNYTSEAYAEVKAEKEKQNKRELENKINNEKTEELKDVTDSWENITDRLNTAISFLKRTKMKKDYIDGVKADLASLKTLVGSMEDKKQAKKTYENFEKKVNEALKEQKKIKSKVTSIDDKKLAKKLGMNTKNKKGNAEHVRTGSDLDKSFVSGL